MCDVTKSYFRWYDSWPVLDSSGSCRSGRRGQAAQQRVMSNVMSHMWMSHVPHMNACEWIMSHRWMHDFSHMNESCPSYYTYVNKSCEWVISLVLHICEWVMWMSHVPSITHHGTRVILQVWMSHFPRMNASYPIHACDMTHLHV